MSGLAVLGIDPGLNGGIAILHPKDGMILETMPTIGNQMNPAILSDMIQEYLGEIRLAVLEQVHSMPKQGVASSFKFGRTVGVIEGILAAHRVRYFEVRPQEWMKEMHQGTPASMDPKERGRLAFTRIFPGVNAMATPKSRVMHDGLVDAALIAEYANRKIQQGMWT